MKNSEQERADEMERYRQLQSVEQAAAAVVDNRSKRWQEILRNNPPAQFRRLPADDTEGGEA